jgi:hypothetical protein
LTGTLSAGGRCRPVIVECGESALPTTTDEEIEAEARAVLRETIQRSGWYQNLRGSEREQLIAQDVDRHWHVMIADAVKRLEQRRGV